MVQSEATAPEAFQEPAQLADPEFVDPEFEPSAVAQRAEVEWGTAACSVEPSDSWARPAEQAAEARVRLPEGHSLTYLALKRVLAFVQLAVQSVGPQWLAANGLQCPDTLLFLVHWVDSLLEHALLTEWPIAVLLD